MEIKEQLEGLKTDLQQNVKSEVSTAVEAVKSEVSVKMDEIDNRIKGIDAHLAEQAKFAKPVIDEKSILNQLKTSSKQLSAMKDDHSAKGVQMNVKAAAAITTGNYTGGTYGLTELDSERTSPARRSPFLRELVRVKPQSKPYAVWTEKVNRDGGAGATAEGAIKSIADFDWQEQTAKVQKITEYMKASKESLDDIQDMYAEIQAELLSGVALKLDTDLLSGNGTSPNIKGILSYAPTFSVTGTPFITTGGGVKSANRFDVIRVAAWIVNNNYFNANAICVNSVDAAQMDLVKDANGNYVLPPFSTSGGQTISGLRVVVNNGIAAGTFLAGDFSKSTLGIREDITLSVGYENDDFTKNFVTILAEMRAVHYIKANHVNAFVQGNFATAITAMSV